MRAKLFALISFALSLLLLMPVTALAGRAIQDNGGGTVTLRSRGDTPENAHGSVKFDVDVLTNGVTEMKTTVDVDNLPKESGRVFSVWLVDDNGTTDEFDDDDEDFVTDGDVQALDAFNTDEDGNGKATASRHLVSVAPFDRIIVTEQRKQGFSTGPSGDVVLSGRIP